MLKPGTLSDAQSQAQPRVAEILAVTGSVDIAAEIKARM